MRPAVADHRQGAGDRTASRSPMSRQRIRDFHSRMGLRSERELSMSSETRTDRATGWPRPYGIGEPRTIHVDQPAAGDGTSPPASSAASTAASRSSSRRRAARAFAATRRTRPRRATRARRPCGSTHYQNARDRLTTPLRRRPDGASSRSTGTPRSRDRAPSWCAFATRTAAESIFYYGGGGQGNHLGGAYSAATRRALGSIYSSNALAQEKTGEFWVDGQLFGRPRCHTTGDFEHAEVAVFVGKNPWQSHGFPRARAILRAIAGDPARTLIVIDPRRTETAELADYHLQVRPGIDAFLLSALLAVLLEEDLLDRRASSPSTRPTAIGSSSCCAPCRSPTTAPAPASPRTSCAPSRAASPAAASVSIYRRPRHPAGAAQHAELVSREARLPAHRQLRAAGRDEHPHQDGRPRRRQGERARHHRSAATASSPA